MKFLNEQMFIEISDHVEEECKRRGVDGVLSIADTEDDTVIYWQLIGRVSCLDDASDGKKYNLLAIVLAKVAYVLTHLGQSGKVEYEGEVPYRGGIPSENGEFVYAFSGGTEDQDVEIATSAYEFHKSLQ